MPTNTPMDPENPFRAGMALAPPILAGRDRFLDEFRTFMARVRHGDGAQTRIYVGPRVLLG